MTKNNLRRRKRIFIHSRSFIQLHLTPSLGHSSASVGRFHSWPLEEDDIKASLWVCDPESETRWNLYFVPIKASSHTIRSIGFHLAFWTLYSFWRGSPYCMAEGRVHPQISGQLMARHLWVWALAKGYLGSALRVFSHLPLPPEHLPCLGLEPRTLGFFD